MESRGLLAPGFRFHPTDEELVRYYLRRKIYGRKFKSDLISEIDIYKVEPWDLPGMSMLKTRDLEWYFFSALDKKYGNGARTNRATGEGYWKTTGKDRAVYHKSQVVGMKKTLVYHNGRAPKGQRTNWVMHEYRLIDEELDRAGIPQDAFVLCRIFQKSGAGPKNGEQYGAPFVEEEWEDDELHVLSKDEVAEELNFGNDIYLDGDDLDQILGTDATLDGSHYEENSGIEGTNNSSNAQNWLQPPDEKKSIDLVIQQNIDAGLLMPECIGETSKNAKSENEDYLLNELTAEASDDLQSSDDAFLEANDLSKPIEVDQSAFDMLEEYLTFFDANDDFQNTGFDPSLWIGNDDLFSDQALLPQKNIGEVTQLMSPYEEQIEDQNESASSSKLQPTRLGSGPQYPFMKQASEMLGNIHAPPAFASEFPTNDATLRLNSLSQSTTSVHVSAGLIHVRDTAVGGNGMGLPLQKHWNYNIVLSFGLSRGSDNSAVESVYSIHPAKATSALSRGWFYYLFFSVLMVSMSLRFGSIFCAS